MNAAMFAIEQDEEDRHGYDWYGNEYGQRIDDCWEYWDYWDYWGYWRQWDYYNYWYADFDFDDYDNLDYYGKPPPLKPEDGPNRHVKMMVEPEVMPEGDPQYHRGPPMARRLTTKVRYGRQRERAKPKHRLHTGSEDD
jgi:hypothetical protein